MAKNSRPKSRDMAAGWKRQALQVPDALQQAFNEEMRKWGQTGVRNSGTAMMALYVGAPVEIRDGLYLFIVREYGGDPARLSVEAVWREFVRLYEERLTNKIRQSGTADEYRKPADPAKSSKGK